MSDQDDIQMNSIASTERASRFGPFTSAVSMTAIICLFVVLMIMLLERI